MRKDNCFVYGLETEHDLYIKKIKLCDLSEEKFLTIFLNMLSKTRDLVMDGFSKNHGGRFYVDLRRVMESCTPECENIKDLVLYHLAQEKELQETLVKFQDSFGHSALLKRNTDYHGHSLGSHENYFIAPQYNPQYNFTKLITPYLLPFLVVRPLICGAGKISAEIPRIFWEQINNLTPEYDKKRIKKLRRIFEDKMRFQISQRADYITALIDSNPHIKRGFIDEMKYDCQYDDRSSSNKGRLHISCGDSNRCPASLSLRMGTTALIIETYLNNGFKELPPQIHLHPESFKNLHENITVPQDYDLLSSQKPKTQVQNAFRFLENFQKPIIDFLRISRDPNLNTLIRLADGRRIHPLEIHEYYLEKTKEYLEKTNQFGGWKKEVWMLWRQVISSLKIKDFKSLIGIVDWITLKHTIDAICQRKGLNYGDAYIRKLETSYFDLYPDPERSLFEWLKNRGKIQMMFEEDEIEEAGKKSPSGRAAFRTFILENTNKNDVCDIDWDKIILNVEISDLFYEKIQKDLRKINIQNSILSIIPRGKCTDHSYDLEISIETPHPINMEISYSNFIYLFKLLNEIQNSKQIK